MKTEMPSFLKKVLVIHIVTPETTEAEENISSN
jgi:hypothetical protein